MEPKKRLLKLTISYESIEHKKPLKSICGDSIVNNFAFSQKCPDFHLKLNSILSNEEECIRFLTFLRSHHCAENLLFLIDYTIFKNEENFEKKEERRKKIEERYVCEDAPLPLNIDDSVSKDLASVYDFIFNLLESKISAYEKEKSKYENLILSDDSGVEEIKTMINFGKDLKMVKPRFKETPKTEEISKKKNSSFFINLLHKKENKHSVNFTKKEELTNSK